MTGSKRSQLTSTASERNWQSRCYCTRHWIGSILAMRSSELPHGNQKRSANLLTLIPRSTRLQQVQQQPHPTELPSREKVSSPNTKDCVGISHSCAHTCNQSNQLIHLAEFVWFVENVAIPYAFLVERQCTDFRPRNQLKSLAFIIITTPLSLD